MELDKFFQEVVSECGLILLEYSADPGGRSPKVKVVVDTEAGVTVGEIEEVTRKIKDWVGMEDCFPDGFQLEVTSPGVNYPLVRQFQFIKNIDRRVRVWHRNSQLPNPIEGILRNVTDEGIELKNSSGVHGIAEDEVVEGRLVLK